SWRRSRSSAARRMRLTCEMRNIASRSQKRFIKALRVTQQHHIGPAWPAQRLGSSRRGHHSSLGLVDCRGNFTVFLEPLQLFPHLNSAVPWIVAKPVTLTGKYQQLAGYIQSE